ncbi:MAG: protein kinase [Myxococcota bacterium]
MSGADLRPGDRVGRLVVLREVGRGASGVVLEAYDPRLDRNVALKLLHERLDPEREERARKRLVKEAQAMAQLSHPNVVAVHDVTTVRLGEQTHALVEMEYVPGSTLEQWLAERGGAEWREILDVLLLAGEGLAAAHATGLVHRDFKPANVLMDEGQRPKVSDFGLVRRADEVDRSSATPVSSPTALDVPLTVTGTLLGTPAYMAPELFDGLPADAKSDQFAYCVTLYEALHGVRPFTGETLAQLAHATHEHDLARPSRGRRVPGFVQRALVRGLQPDPAKRHESMAALLDALRADPGRTVRRLGVIAALGAGLTGAAMGVAPYFEPGTLDLTMEYSGQRPAGVVVMIDEERQELVADAVTVDLAPGFHRLSIEAPDYEPVSNLIFEVERGQTLTVKQPLQHEQGTVELRTFPRGAGVTIGARELGSTLDGLQVDTGAHALRVTLPGHHDARLAVDVAAKQTVAMAAYLARATVFEHFDAGLSLGRGRLGDADGDGHPDLWYRNYASLSAISPTSGERLWTRRVSKDPNAAFSIMVDLDGDGVPDPVLLGTDDGGAILRAFSGAVQSDDKPLWTFVPASDRREAPLVPPVHLETDQGSFIVATTLGTGQVTVIDAKSGAERRTEPLAPPIFGLVASRDASHPWIAVAHRGGVSLLDADGTKRWTYPIKKFDEGLAAGLNKRNRLEHIGRERRGSWMLAAPLDEHPGDDVVLVAATDPGGGPLLGLSSETKAEVLRGPRLHPFGLENAGDLDHDGTHDFIVQRSPPDLDTVHPEPGRGDLPRAVVSGRDGRQLHPLQPGQRVGRWPCGGEPAIIEYGNRPFRAWRVGDEQPIVPLPALDETVDMICTDWNGDGRDDAVISSDHHGLRAYEVVDGEVVELGGITFGRRIDDVVPLGDVDGDAMPDLLLAAKGPVVTRGSRVRWGRAYGSRIRAQPLVVDLDGDGASEVAAFTGEDSDDHLQILAAEDGRRLKAFPESGPGMRTPAALDGAAPGTRDLIFAHGLLVQRLQGTDLTLHRLEVDPPIHTYAGVGIAADDSVWISGFDDAPPLTNLARAPDEPHRWNPRLTLPGRGGSNVRPQFAPLDDDASREVVAVVDGGRLVVVDEQSGECQWSRWIGPGFASWGPTLVDLDGDGRPEIITSLTEDAPSVGPSCTEASARPKPSRTPGLVALAGADGRVLWRSPGAGLGAAPIVVTHGDERWLMGVAKDLGLYSIDLDGGTRIAPDPTLKSSFPLSVGDINGDGWPEVLLVDRAGTLQVIDAVTGAQQWSWSDLGAGALRPPTLADIDVPADGRQELLVSTGKGFVLALDGMFVRRLPK